LYGKGNDVGLRRTDVTVHEVEQLASRIVELIDEELPESALEKAPDFFESVKEKTLAINETVATTNRATSGQVRALKNMLGAVEAWQRG